MLTEYRGLTVAQLQELRRALGDDANYAVVKNTLTKIAAKDAGVTRSTTLLQGPSAIAFVKGDPVEAAKGLRDFAKAHPHLVIKGGVLDGKSLSPAELTKLADLESREVLLAKMAGALQASLTNAVSLFAAPLAQTARVIEALRQKAEQDPSVLPGAAPETPVAAEPEVEAEEPSAPRPRPRRPPPRLPPRRAPPPRQPPRRPPRADRPTQPPPTTEGRTRHHGEAQHRRAP